MGAPEVIGCGYVFRRSESTQDCGWADKGWTDGVHPGEE